MPPVAVGNFVWQRRETRSGSPCATALPANDAREAPAGSKQGSHPTKCAASVVTPTTSEPRTRARREPFISAPRAAPPVASAREYPPDASTARQAGPAACLLNRRRFAGGREDTARADARSAGGPRSALGTDGDRLGAVAGDQHRRCSRRNG